MEFDGPGLFGSTAAHRDLYGELLKCGELPTGIGFDPDSTLTLWIGKFIQNLRQSTLHELMI